jgi:diacylglycerol kinase (ATP)
MRKATGLGRIYYATKFSLQGIQTCWQSEPAFRFELFLLCFFAPASFIVARSPLQWAVLMLPIMGVLAMEMVNTAIERVVDHISLENHPLLGQAKDLGSAAVFMFMMATLLVWGAVIAHNWPIV